MVIGATRKRERYCYYNYYYYFIRDTMLPTFYDIGKKKMFILY